MLNSNAEFLDKQLLHCIFVGPSWGSYTLQDQFVNLFETLQYKTKKLHKIHITALSMEKKECVMGETMLSYYKRNDKKYKNCLGDTLEAFIELGKFRMLLCRISKIKQHLCCTLINVKLLTIVLKPIKVLRDDFSFDSEYSGELENFSFQLQMLTPEEEKLLRRRDSEFLRTFDSIEDPDNILFFCRHEGQLNDSDITPSENSDDTYNSDHFDSDASLFYFDSSHDSVESYNSIDVDEIQFRDHDSLTDSDNLNESVHSVITEQSGEDLPNDSVITFNNNNENTNSVNETSLDYSDELKNSNNRKSSNSTNDVNDSDTSDKILTNKYALFYSCQRSITFSFEYHGARLEFSETESPT